MRTGSFACLPGDPAAALPGDREWWRTRRALRAEVRPRWPSTWRTPSWRASARGCGDGPRALWGMATDEIVEGLWYVGRPAAASSRARRRAGADYCRAATKPHACAAPYAPRRSAGPNGEVLPTRDRASCCMFYTLRPDGHLRHLSAHLRGGAGHQTAGRRRELRDHAGPDPAR
ncbi:hypothetical protein ACRAWF_10035 [Streptomyces sp. L7]